MINMIGLPPSLASEIDAALAFWSAAGVSDSFVDDARAWLHDPAVSAAVPTQPVHDNTPRAVMADKPQVIDTPLREPTDGRARHDFWGDAPPASLVAFRDWWMTSPDLGTGGYPRIAPRGNAGAKLMAIVPDPESGDSDQLLSGPQGRLLTNILAAMGLAPHECYLASALPRHTPVADLQGLAASGMDAVTAHHIALVYPQHVVLFGKGLKAFVAPLGAAPEQSLREINQTRIHPPVMITETLGSMLDMPQLKVAFWRRWMEWSA